MDLKQLRYFVVSVDCGSFKKAAEVLYTSQPHISKTVRNLEEELQAELLKRKARGVEVTEMGKKVYEYACRILIDSGKLLELRDRQELSCLRIAAMPNDSLSSLFHLFWQSMRQPGMQADYIEGSLEEIFQALHRHTAELGFVLVGQNQMTALRQLLEYKRLEFTELGQGEPALFAGAGNMVCKEGRVGLKALRDLHFVQLKESQETLGVGLFQGSEDFRSLKRRGQVLTTNSRRLMIRTLLETELCSMGNSLLPEIAGQEGIRQLPILGLEEKICFGCIRRKRDGFSEAAAQFVEFVRERL